MRNLSSTELKRLHRDWRRTTDARIAIILDGVQGPFNVGAIVRTAAAERVDHLWCAGGATTPAHPKAGKTALGTDRYVTWSEVEGAAQAIAEAREQGFVVVGVELADDAVPLHELALSGDVCLVVGNEDRGLGQDTLERCDLVGYVPQLGKVGSLNVATAASIAIYEARRQAWQTPKPGRGT